jgi:hypothetical protein
MLYHVYKLHLSTDVSAAINAHGWDKSPEGAAYSRLQFAKGENPEMPMHVMCAALMGLYHHGLTLDAPSIDKVFDYDNGAPHSMVADVHPVYHCRGLRSLSVGDVVVSKDGVSVCCSYGWASLPKHAATAFAVMAKQIACQRPNALPNKAA